MKNLILYIYYSPLLHLIKILQSFSVVFGLHNEVNKLPYCLRVMTIAMKHKIDFIRGCPSKIPCCIYSFENTEKCESHLFCLYYGNVAIQYLSSDQRNISPIHRYFKFNVSQYIFPLIWDPLASRMYWLSAPSRNNPLFYIVCLVVTSGWALTKFL